MKYVLIATLGATFIVATAFNKTSQSALVKEVYNSFAQVKDNLFFSKFETSNKDYREYLNFLQQTHQPEQYKLSLLDTSKWAIENGNNKPLVVYYHSNPSFDRYPVVTVSYENALRYCSWLTEQYNHDPSRNYKKVIFRLPTESEWIFATTGGKQERVYSWDGNYVRNKKGEYMANIKHINEANLTYNSTSKAFDVVKSEQDKREAILAEKQSFYPNEFGLYNMIGNAAEMIAEKGVAKGGSYNDAGYDVRVQSSKKYTEPSSEIGFRVVMEVVEK